MAVTSQDIQKLYIAYFNRPADYFGLQFQVTAANATSLEAVATNFANSPEFTETYAGQTDAQFVNSLYQNLFGRSADLPGLSFWLNLLNTGVVTKGSIALELLKGAINQDATTVANKVAAAEAFYAAIDTTDEATFYSGADANAVAKMWLAGITTDASLAAAIDPVALNNTLSQVVAEGKPEVPSTTTNLTIGLDNVKGGAGNDIFNAGLENSLSAFDNLDGGAGTDTLNVLLSAGTTSLPGGVIVKNIEIANINTASTGGFAADVSSWTGLEQLNLTASQQAAGNITVNGTSGVQVNATGATTGAITVGTTTAPLGAVTIAQNVEVAAGAQAGAINVKGGSTVAIAQNLTTNNGAGTSTGSAVTVTGTAATTNVTVSQTAPVAAVAAVAGVVAVTGATEVATITVTGGLTAGQSVTVGGLTYTSIGVSTQADIVAAFDGLAPGAITGTGDTVTGDFTGTFTGDFTTAAAVGNVITATGTFNTAVADLTEVDAQGVVTLNTSTQGVTAVSAVTAVANVTGIAAGAVTVADANAASTTAAGTITTVSLQNFGASTVNSGALETLNLSGNGGGVTVTAGALSTAKVSTLALNLNGATAGTVTLDNDYKTVNLNVATGNSSATLVASAATALNIAGDKNVTLANQTLHANAVITSTSTGNVTLSSALGTAQTYTGAEGVDTISVAAGGTKAITTGGGNDVVIYGGALASGGSIDGGEGTDTLRMTADLAATATNTTAFAGTVANFEVLSLTDAGAGAVVINMANADGINSLSVAGTTGGILTVNNAAAEFTLTQTVAAANNIVVNLASAVGSADVVNLAFAAGNGFSNGAHTTTVAGVETVNITTTDTSATVANSAAVTAIINAAAATTVNVSGALGVNLSTGMNQTVLTTLDASGLTGNTATGGLTFTSGALAEAASIMGSAAGTNTIDFSAATKVVTYTGGTGIDVINFASANTQSNVITLGNGANEVNGTIANGNNTITGGTGADKITVGNGNNTIDAGAGADVVTVGSGSNTVTLGAGNDTLILNAVNTSSAVFTTVTDLAAGDKIDFTAVFANATGKLGAALTSGVNDYQTFLNAAAGKGIGQVSWFQFGGDTYLVQDNSAQGSFVAGGDTIVKLTGMIDLSNSTLTIGTDVLTIA